MTAIAVADIPDAIDALVHEGVLAADGNRVGLQYSVIRGDLCTCPSAAHDCGLKMNAFNKRDPVEDELPVHRA